MTLISCDVRQLYPSSLGTLACSCAAERKEVMGGTDRDTSLHDRHDATVADLAPPINPILSLIPPPCLRARVLSILQKCFAILGTANTPVITSLIQAGKQRHREAGQREKPFHMLGMTPKGPPSPNARERWGPFGATGQEHP